jgi:hypothetical protein
VAPILAICNREVQVAPLAHDDEEVVDYEASTEQYNIKINGVHLSSDYSVVPEAEGIA